MTDSEIPEDCAPGTYKLVREYFVANFMDGDDGGVLTVRQSVLADEVAELFSSEHWRETWSEALMAELRQARGGIPPSKKETKDD